MSYDIDVFISYPRSELAGPWTRDVFKPELQKRLRAEIGRAEIFLDETLEPGGLWPIEIQKKLWKSRYLIAIWDATFFDPSGSGWCRAELGAMRARARHVFGNSRDHEKTLVCPILLADGKMIPESEKVYQHLDFCQFNRLTPGRVNVTDYYDFEREVGALCQRLAGWLENTPPFDESWPMAEHPDIELARQVLTLPRIL